MSEPAYFAFLYQPRQINDIVNFCCTDINATTLAIDTTFNLCNLWVTYTTYRNKRLINLETRKSPVFLGPMMFHFRKDDDAFARFGLELLHANKDVVKLKQVAVDMDSAIYNEFQYHFPDLGRFLYVCCLSKRDESELVKLLAKTNLNASQRQKFSSDILKDIYGNLAGGFYEFGLAEATGKTDFDINLFSLKERWKSLCPGFHIWFKRKRCDDFVILKACTFKMHFLKNLSQEFKKESTEISIKSLSKIAERQDLEQIKPIFHGGRYALSQPYKKFSVESSV